MKKYVSQIAVILFSILLGGRAQADLDPASVAITLEPGESETIATTVTLPEQPPKLDVLLLVDLSNSYTDNGSGLNDIDRIKQFAPDMIDGVRALVPDSQFALATFSDFPFPAWGEFEIAGGAIVAADSPYQLDMDLTADRAAWLQSIDQLCTPGSARCGSLGDDRESQYEALFQSVTGAGLDVPDLAGAPPNFGDLPAGQQVSFRDDAIKVIVLATDAPFHETGDSGLLLPYPGANRDDAVLALQDAGVKVVVIKGIDAGLPSALSAERDAQMIDLADATGGAVVDSAVEDSSDIVAKLTEGLDNITFLVRAESRVSCAPLQVEFTPDFYETASAGEALPFDVSITVPQDITETSVSCVVDYLADDVVIDSQQIEVTIASEAPPSCPRRRPDTYKKWKSSRKSKYSRRSGSSRKSKYSRRSGSSHKSKSSRRSGSSHGSKSHRR